MDMNQDMWIASKLAIVDVFGPLAAKKLDVFRLNYPSAFPIDIVELVALDLDENPEEVLALAMKMMKKAVSLRKSADTLGKSGVSQVKPLSTETHPPEARKWISHVKPIPSKDTK